MIKFRQKMYIAPLAIAGGLMNTAMTAGTVGSLIQGQQQMKQAEEHQEENAKIQKQQIMAENRKAEAIQNLANSGAANTSAGQAIQYAASDTKILKNQRLFAMRYNIQDIKGFGKDLGNHILKNKKHIGGFVGFGVAMTGGKYLADKMIQKDKSVMPQQNEKNKQKAYSEVKKQVSPKKGKNIISKLGGAGLGMGLTMGALQPLGSYIGDKAQQQSVSKKSEERQFANPSIFRRGINAIKRSGWGSRQNMNVIDNINNEKSKVYDPRTWKWLKKVKHNPARGLANVYNSFNMMGGETGMKSFRDSLTGQGTSGSRLSKDIVNFTKRHGATSMAAIGAIGGGALFKTSELAEKGTEKTLRTIDKNAFKYTDSKEEEMK